MTKFDPVMNKSFNNTRPEASRSLNALRSPSTTGNHAPVYDDASSSSFDLLLEEHRSAPRPRSERTHSASAPAIRERADLRRDSSQREAGPEIEPRRSSFDRLQPERREPIRPRQGTKRSEHDHDSANGATTNVDEAERPVETNESEADRPRRVEARAEVDAAAASVAALQVTATVTEANATVDDSSDAVDALIEVDAESGTTGANLGANLDMAANNDVALSGEGEGSLVAPELNADPMADSSAIVDTDQTDPAVETSLIAEAPSTNTIEGTGRGALATGTVENGESLAGPIDEASDDTDQSLIEGATNEPSSSDSLETSLAAGTGVDANRQEPAGPENGALESGSPEGSTPTSSGLERSGLEDDDLANADLANADLANADLEGAGLANADLEGVGLEDTGSENRAAETSSPDDGGSAGADSDIAGSAGTGLDDTGSGGTGSGGTGSGGTGSDNTGSDNTGSGTTESDNTVPDAGAADPIVVDGATATEPVARAAPRLSPDGARVDGAGVVQQQRAAEAAAAAVPVGAPQAAEFDGEVWDQVQRAVNLVRQNGPGRHEVSLVLRPDDLGSVSIELVQRGDEVAVRIVTQTSAAQDRLDRGRLLAELQAAGIDPSSVDISHHDPGRSDGGNGEGEPGSERSHAATGDASSTPATRPVRRSAAAGSSGGSLDLAL